MVPVPVPLQSQSLPWAIRVASRAEVGGGHVRRCQALAVELRRSVRVEFILDPGSFEWQRELSQLGFGARFDSGAETGPWAGCVLDGYTFTAADRRRWRQAAAYLAVIDDLDAAPDHADFVLRTSAPSVAYGAGVAGISYALLAPQYADAPLREPTTELRHVVVAFGLRDSADGTSTAIAGLLQARAAGVAPRVTVVLGSHAPHLARVSAELAKSFPGSAEVVTTLTNLRPLLLKTDLAIGNGGVGLLERMACATPTITIVSADNQWSNAREAERAEATLLLGDLADATPSNIAAAVVRLARDPQHRTTMAAKARAAVDGRGAQRAASALLAAASRE